MAVELWAATLPEAYTFAPMLLLLALVDVVMFTLAVVLITVGCTCLQLIRPKEFIAQVTVRYGSAYAPRLCNRSDA